jgi:hypothetical protein
MDCIFCAVSLPLAQGPKKTKKLKKTVLLFRFISHFITHSIVFLYWNTIPPTTTTTITITTPTYTHHNNANNENNENKANM